MTPGKIFLIPSPISDFQHEKVISQQIKDVIGSLRLFFAENIRTSRRFISSLGLGLSIEELQFEELNKETPDDRVRKLLEMVVAGRAAGVISEAGCPGIADPGARLVQIAHRAGIEVVPLAGPSSIFMSLMSSGFSGQNFVFHGYLPVDKKAAQEKIKQMEREVSAAGVTQIFMETPYRNNQLFETLLQTCKPASLLCVCSEITAENQLIKTCTVSDWKGNVPDLHKRPTVFLLGK